MLYKDLPIFPLPKQNYRYFITFITQSLLTDAYDVFFLTLYTDIDVPTKSSYCCNVIFQKFAEKNLHDTIYLYF